jgi:phytoene dehydrogenase-like protein
MTNTYDAIVIGSGLGGLTAGALYARTGAKVLLIERNDAFGGAATTYRRGAMIVEASLHETTHPDAAGDPKGAIFEALDLDSEIDLLPAENFHEIRCPLIGEPFVLPHGFDAVEARLVERFAHQEKAIRSFLRQVKRTQQALDYMSAEHDNLWRLTHTAELPLELWAVMRDIRSSLSAVLQRCFGDDEAVKFALAANLPYYSDDPDNFWWLGYAVAQGGFLKSGGYFIRGGSQTLSDRLAAIIREEGGETLNACEAVAVDISPDGAVAGVRYRSRDGTDHAASAGIVFANAAPHVVARMLPEDRREAFMAPYRDRPLSISLFSATLGLDRPAREFGISSYSTQLIPAWMTRLSDFRDVAALLGDMPGERLPAFGVADYSRLDPGLASEGIYPLAVVCVDRLENWQDLDDGTYHRRKDAWCDAIIGRLDEEWPGIAGAVVETTVATARTMHDYLNTPGGAVYGFAPVPPEHFPKGPPQRLATSIDGLWIASSFAGFGGYTGAMMAGAGAARAAMRKVRSKG